MQLITVIASLTIVPAAVLITREISDYIYFKTFRNTTKRWAREIARPTTSTVLIFGGDPSSDLVGLSLCEAIKKEVRQHELKRLYTNGSGGPEMRAAHVVDNDLTKYSSIGWGAALNSVFLRPVEAILQLRKVLESFDEDPDLIILMSNPGLNIYIARKAARKKIPVIYMLPPENWTHEFKYITERQNKALARCVTKIYTNFKFELNYFKGIVEKYGGDAIVRYLGNPLVDQIPDRFIENAGNKDYRKKLRATILRNAKTKWVVGLMPGSRRKEIRLHLPVMLKTAEALAKKEKYNGEIQFVIPVLSNESRREIESILASKHREKGYRVQLIEENKRYEAIFVCDLMILASGTASLEVACLGVPSIIIYKVGLADYWLWRLGIVRLTQGFIGLPNLVAKMTTHPDLKKGICPEIIGNVTPEQIISEATTILDNPELAQKISSTLLEVARINCKKGIEGIASAIADQIPPLQPNSLS